MPARKSDRTRCEAHPTECRIADGRAKGAKTVWQLAHAGFVGSRVLLGLPALERLTADPRLMGRAAIWPFRPGLCVPEAPVVIAEIHPSLLGSEIGAGKEEGEILDRAQVRANAMAPPLLPTRPDPMRLTRDTL